MFEMSHLWHSTMIANVVQLRGCNIRRHKIRRWRLTVERVASSETDHFGVSRYPSISTLVIFRQDGGQGGTRDLRFRQNRVFVFLNRDILFDRTLHTIDSAFNCISRSVTAVSSVLQQWSSHLWDLARKGSNKAQILCKYEIKWGWGIGFR